MQPENLELLVSRAMPFSKPRVESSIESPHMFSRSFLMFLEALIVAAMKNN
jgi:hypothetical protein